MELLKELHDKMDDTIHNSEEYDDHEGDMAVADLRTICQQAQELLDFIEPEEELQGWVQAKLTKAADYINSVHRYTTNHKDQLEDTDMMEAKDPCWKGYEMVGHKKKNGKKVPNCVSKK